MGVYLYVSFPFPLPSFSVTMCLTCSHEVIWVVCSPPGGAHELDLRNNTISFVNVKNNTGCTIMGAGESRLCLNVSCTCEARYASVVISAVTAAAELLQGCFYLLCPLSCSETSKVKVCLYLTAERCLFSHPVSNGSDKLAISKPICCCYSSDCSSQLF